MTENLLKIFKKCLTIIGTKLDPRTLWKLEMVVNYMKIGRWMKDNGFQVEERLGDRDLVFDAVTDKLSNENVLYLEFGVHKGASMKYWSDKLKNRESILHGFDSFIGLPEAWDDVTYVKGHLSVDGNMPVIDDDRIEFFKGWFEDTLPTYKLPKHDNLVITLDADLYSSTIYVLRHFRDSITYGTYIFFDDMSRPDHEPRAFAEFIQESGLQFELVATDYALNRSFFMCTSKKD